MNVDSSSSSSDSESPAAFFEERASNTRLVHMRVRLARLDNAARAADTCETKSSPGDCSGGGSVEASLRISIHAFRLGLKDDWLFA